VEQHHEYGWRFAGAVIATSEDEASWAANLSRYDVEEGFVGS